MNPRQMKRMMRQLGIDTEDISDVEEIVIKTASKDYVFYGATVTKMTVQGQTTFQILGEPRIVEKASQTAPEEVTIPDEDVKLVAEKAGVSEEEARRALQECGGEPAEAIIRLMSK